MSHGTEKNEFINFSELIEELLVKHSNNVSLSAQELSERIKLSTKICNLLIIEVINNNDVSPQNANKTDIEQVTDYKGIETEVESLDIISAVNDEDLDEIKEATDHKSDKSEVDILSVFNDEDLDEIKQAIDIKSENDVFFNDENITELIWRHPSIISAAIDLSKTTGCPREQCIDIIKPEMGRHCHSNLSGLNWISIGNCIARRMWTKLAKTIKDIVVNKDINIYDLSKERVDEMIDFVNSIRRRKLSIEESAFIHDIVYRARNIKPLEYNHINQNNIAAQSIHQYIDIDIVLFVVLFIRINIDYFELI